MKILILAGCALVLLPALLLSVQSSGNADEPRTPRTEHCSFRSPIENGYGSVRV